MVSLEIRQTEIKLIRLIKNSFIFQAISSPTQVSNLIRENFLKVKYNLFPFSRIHYSCLRKKILPQIHMQEPLTEHPTILHIALNPLLCNLSNVVVSFYFSKGISLSFIGCNSSPISPDVH